MKNITFDEARAKFEALFNLASGGELVIVTRDHQRVVLHSFPSFSEPEIAPPGYFNADYESSDISEINALAAHGPELPLP